MLVHEFDVSNKKHHHTPKHTGTGTSIHIYIMLHKVPWLPPLLMSLISGNSEGKNIGYVCNL